MSYINNGDYEDVIDVAYLQSEDATVVQVSFDGWEAVGSSKRHGGNYAKSEDEFDGETGYNLALGRALEKLGKEMVTETIARTYEPPVDGEVEL